jgi:pimeloyl-ACP methyl ester carboxylesterase
MSLKEQSISGATIDAGGISLKYFAAGIGDPVVLLHCTAGSGRQWANVAEALRSDFRVIAPDLCGYGDTTHWPGYGTFNLSRSKRISLLPCSICWESPRTSSAIPTAAPWRCNSRRGIRVTSRR